MDEREDSSPSLFLVATPIGNLQDVSLRAIETLRSVDLIAAEDTRRTIKLLQAHDIQTRMMPFHAHNERRVVGRLVERLRTGQKLALVSDAGTPGISDPAFSLVRACIEAEIGVTMIPGPAALVPAAVLSGLPIHHFCFLGFPPRKSGARRRLLAAAADNPHTVVLYESCYRINALLQDALAVLGDRRACVANDLTKKFERVDRGSLSQLAARLAAAGTPRGEFVLVVEGKGDDTDAQAPAPATAPPPSHVGDAVHDLEDALERLRDALATRASVDDDLAQRAEALAGECSALVAELGR